MVRPLPRLRQNKAKYGRILLRRLGAAPPRPFVTTGGSDAAAPDPVWVLQRVRGGREGLRIVLARQNPGTGLWGQDGVVPRAAQIQAALKIVGRLKWSFGMRVPHLERMADTCIAWHGDRSFYHHDGGGVSHCDLRNAAEMVYLCLLDNPGYRGDELAATMAGICDTYQQVHGTPDGAYARGRGTEPVVYDQVALVAPAADRPRGDLGGTNGAAYSFSMANHILGWGVPHLRSPHEGWQAGVAARPYRVVASDDGRVEIEVQASAA